ncbi:hypothetical protein HZ326_9243 [Fusarium oxysporum f. sp. albedinis]|nr:hypothetical protein HZ326_9243 [Fusarium oxysporum f. sp. albedinis]
MPFSDLKSQHEANMVAFRLRKTANRLPRSECEYYAADSDTRLVVTTITKMTLSLVWIFIRSASTSAVAAHSH